MNLIMLFIIDTTSEKLWEAIIVPEIIRQYWLHENVSEWKIGSAWQHIDKDNRAVRVVGTILEIMPHQSLIWTWVDPVDKSDNSEVIFKIKPEKNSVFLQVILFPLNNYTNYVA